MNEEELIRYAASLPGVTVVTASPATGAPEVAWGDSFCFVDPESGVAADRRFPFATIVTKDYHGFDEASELDREGVFRLNVSVGRHRFQELIGYPPGEHAEHTVGVDYTAFDSVLPHPAYARQSWVSILNPGERTSEQARSLVAESRDRAAARRRPRR